MDRETCRKMIMSEEFIDFIAPIYREITPQEAERARACVQSMDFGFQAVYVDKTLTQPVSLEYYRYNSIPNCYQLMDLEAMEFNYGRSRNQCSTELPDAEPPGKWNHGGHTGYRN